MAKVKIEKGVPVSKKTKNGGNKYPFDKMEVGDSFFTQLKKGQTHIGLQGQLLQNARSWSTYAKVKRVWVSRREGDGIRIWRNK